MRADALDCEFLEHLPEIKEGYRQMYPMLSFGGRLETAAERAVPTGRPGGSACFFSGGLDATVTLLRHLEEKPALLTVWGADIKLEDEAGWEHVREHVTSAAGAYGVAAHFVKSDFRSVLREDELGRLVTASGDGWWHGFQHGIALIAHAASLAFIYGWEKLYIASSFTANAKGYTCASDPSIDNHVRFCGCQAVHDGYEMSRQDKAAYLVKRRREALRVCWESSGGKNCCRCEKCYRTILELVSEGADPAEYGFTWNTAAIRRCRYDLLHRIQLPNYYAPEFYAPIQSRMRENRERVKDYEAYGWFLNYDLSRFNDTFGKRLRRTWLWTHLGGWVYDRLKKMR
ncbi:MAG: hypothetical protein IJU29_06315 [Oscillospiraceae bacterium]|nr:hypothetical protein [Oscillospiraceae bacterium]